MKGLRTDGPLDGSSRNRSQSHPDLDDNTSEVSNEGNFNQDGGGFPSFQRLWLSKYRASTRGCMSKFVTAVNANTRKCLRYAIAFKPITSGLFWAFISLLLFALLLTSVIYTWKRHDLLFSSVALGGRFSQVQAKSIDFITGAIVAPILIAVANLCWFIPSKRSAAGANGRAISLATLVELAGTSSGSFNPRKHFILGSSLRPRYILFSCLILLSAIAYTFLTNVIAYEAYTSTSIQTIRDRPWTLGFTRDEWNELQLRLSSYLNYAGWPGFYDRDRTRSNELSFTYANISQLFLWNNVSDTISTLWQVPAYRHSMECRPALFDTFSAQELSDRRQKQNLIDFTMESWRTDSNFFARIPGNITDLNSTTIFYNLIGFKNPRRIPWSRDYDFSPKILLATFTDVSNPLKPPESTTRSPFGNIPHFTFDLYHNMSKWKTVEALGVECTRYQHLGHVNVTRLGGPREHSYGQREWVLSEPQFDLRIPLNYTYLGLTNGPGMGVQPLAPSYHWPGLPLGGIGSPMAAYTCDKKNPRDRMPPMNCVPDFKRWAFNFLYTSVQMEYYAAEMVDRPWRSTRGKPLMGDPWVGWPKRTAPEMVEVSTVDTMLTYRMCYIPALWIGAVAAMLMASCIPLFLLWNGKRNTEVEITPLKLIVDSAVALKDDETLEDVSSWNMKMLNMWSKRTKVRYQLRVVENQDLAPTRQLVLDNNGRYSHEEENEEEALLLEDHQHSNGLLL